MKYNLTLNLEWSEAKLNFNTQATTKNILFNLAA
jgi:hypothetical protein